ncbi:uncharacterized protein At4g14450, chloroplastic-like [Silene latifolia]|uniref:uncharacterized protein At4g14450, chloroplastic-like n=1 Tax=Silene latifolia TaxID=37657 RepID=UPI003D77AFCD
MGDSMNRRRQSNRLQSRAPASILVNRSTEWNVAIPLLSPLASSPPSINRTVEIESRLDPTARTTSSKADGDAQSRFKKWQAAPFCYEASPPLLGASCR